jgi:hypothetical protein
MEIFMIGAWCIWNERNDLIFNGKPPCLAAWKSAFKAQVSEHLIRIKASLHPSILLWLQPCNCLLSSVLLAFLAFWSFGLLASFSVLYLPNFLLGLL